MLHGGQTPPGHRSSHLGLSKRTCDTCTTPTTQRGGGQRHAGSNQIQAIRERTNSGSCSNGSGGRQSRLVFLEEINKSLDPTTQPRAGGIFRPSPPLSKSLGFE